MTYTGYQFLQAETRDKLVRKVNAAMPEWQPLGTASWDHESRVWVQAVVTDNKAVSLSQPTVKAGTPDELKMKEPRKK